MDKRSFEKLIRDVLKDLPPEKQDETLLKIEKQ